MFFCNAIRRQLDPAGAAATERITAAIAELSWGEAAWLMEQEKIVVDTPIAGVTRQLQVKATWDMEEWASDTFVWLKVQVVVRGRRTRWRHKDSTNHWGDLLPDEPEPLIPVDLTALAAAAA